MITKDDLDKSWFPVFYNGNIFKLDWFTKPKLDTTKPINVGIDQSSTSTGITLKNKEVHLTLELTRNGLDVRDYKQALKQELDVLLGGRVLSHFIFEKHGRHISPLHSLINEITDTIKSYTRPMLYDEVIVKGVLPPVWRSGFLISKDYSGRFKREDVKLASVEESIIRYPDMEKYIEYSHKKDGVPDYDGFESFGIIQGYLDMNYTEDGTRIINTSMGYLEGRRFSHIIEKSDEMNLEEDKEKLRQRFGGRKCPIVLGNNSLLLDNALNRVLEDYDEAVIEIPKDSPELSRFIIETGKEYLVGDRYIVYVRRTA